MTMKSRKAEARVREDGTRVYELMDYFINDLQDRGFRKITPVRGSGETAGPKTFFIVDISGQFKNIEVSIDGQYEDDIIAMFDNFSGGVSGSSMYQLCTANPNSADPSSPELIWWAGKTKEDFINDIADLWSVVESQSLRMQESEGNETLEDVARRMGVNPYMKKDVENLFKFNPNFSEDEFWTHCYGKGDDGYDEDCTNAMWEYYEFLQSIKRESKNLKESTQEERDQEARDLIESPYNNLQEEDFEWLREDDETLNYWWNQTWEMESLERNLYDEPTYDLDESKEVSFEFSNNADADEFIDDVKARYHYPTLRSKHDVDKGGTTPSGGKVYFKGAIARLR